MFVLHFCRLSHVQSKSPIRQTAMSFDGRLISKNTLIASSVCSFAICALINQCLFSSAPYLAAVKMGLYGAGMW